MKEETERGRIRQSKEEAMKKERKTGNTNLTVNAKIQWIFISHGTWGLQCHTCYLGQKLILVL